MAGFSSKNLEILEDFSIFLGKIEKPSRICKYSQRKIRPFWGQKYSSKSIDIFIFGRDFGRVSLKNDQKWEILVIFSILPYTDGFLGQF